MKINGVHTVSDETGDTHISIEHSDGRYVNIPAGIYDGFLSSGNNDAIFRPLNYFLETLRPDDEELLFRFYQTIARGWSTKQSLDGLEEAIEDEISLVLARTDMINLLIYFCRDNGPMGSFYPVLKTAGIMDCHTDDKTFYISDYVRLTALSFLVKLLCPVFAKHSDTLESLEHNPDHTLARLLDLVHPIIKNSAICYTYHKFYSVCFSTIDTRKRYFDKRSDISAASLLVKTGVASDDFDYDCLSYVVCRRLVQFDPFLQDDIPNIAIYIADGTKRAAETNLNKLNRQLVH